MMNSKMFMILLAIIAFFSCVYFMLYQMVSLFVWNVWNVETKKPGGKNCGEMQPGHGSAVIRMLNADSVRKACCARKATDKIADEWCKNNI